MASSVDHPLRPFVAPSRVLAGPGATSQAGTELFAIGVSPGAGGVLVIADQALIGLGLVAPLLASLDAGGFENHLGQGITGEPTPEAIAGLLAEARAMRVAAVVGIGGGSAIDAAKLAAAAARNELPLTTGLGPTAVLDDVPPMAAIPTTAGTGAETTAVAMLWHERQKRIFVHPRLVPRVAVLDPDLLSGLPRAVTAASGLDAISHAVESMLSTFRTPLTVAAARSALSRLAGALPIEFEATDPGARQAMSLGAYEAGLALNASVVIGHSIAYTIAARTGLSHGVTCAMALPYCLAYCRYEAEAEIRTMAEVVGVSPARDGFTSWVSDLTASLGIPSSLDAVGIGPDDLPAMAAECCDRYPRPNNPRALEPQAVLHLLRCFHSGDIDLASASTVAGISR
jgi:alcohol dehydrogenase class IV